MMSMDAISRLGFQLANFCDTSGNPSASKVYRAARIILAQDGLVGYFGSGSGVASQEQYHSAYGLAKAFAELELSIPAVIRLGGNGEDRAVEILRDIGAHLPAEVRAYRKDDTPAFIADRFAELVEQAHDASWTPRRRALPGFVGSGYHFPITGGRVWIDDARARADPAAAACVVEHASGLLKLDDEGREPFRAEGRRVILSIALHTPGEVAAGVLQDLHRPVLAVAAQANGRGYRQTDFDERLGETVGAPELLLTCHAAARAEVANDAGLAQDDPRRRVDLGR